MYIRIPSTGGGLKICPKSVDPLQRSALTALYVEHWWPIAANYPYRIQEKNRCGSYEFGGHTFGPQVQQTAWKFSHPWSYSDVR